MALGAGTAGSGKVTSSRGPWLLQARSGTCKLGRGAAFGGCTQCRGARGAPRPAEGEGWCAERRRRPNLPKKLVK